MKKNTNCQHNDRLGDNYGVTCRECHQVLEGYGYGGWFGSNLIGKEQCVHAAWYVVRGGNEVCPYCPEVLRVIHYEDVTSNT